MSSSPRILHTVLTSAKIPTCLEPSGLYRSDGKSPDGITMVPWKCGKLLVWDATCPAFAPSYSSSATSEARAVIFKPHFQFSRQDNWTICLFVYTYVLIFLRCDRCVFVFYSLLILFKYFSKLIEVVLSTVYTLFTYFCKLLKPSF